ncbi:AraC-type DNA-binding protein [Amycolatopsis arida]|uniref:AraC-type DNA-binding protein n=1 Tax=Amycolatopsis arida TaxID=587909 RepID=A0A1I5QEQ6_9PSEU|nr:AraC family transcriptional regulator [Amycolatopsis arida]TDX98804.1 AraC-like DNA-binding protein [Amycolatopsis arida]SFP44470.1 AraC-type DNA-binding protein [Amycolatopsis arida]
MDKVTVLAVERAVDTMHGALAEPLTVDDLARSALFSKFHFCRLFRRTTGLSPARYLSALRLEEAKRLLRATSLSVTDISHLVGYSSVGTFSTRFHHSVGVSPSSYRQGQVPPAEPGAVRGAPPVVTGRVIGPRAVEPVLVGLFRNPIMEGAPVRLTALDHIGPYTLDKVPPGTWHVLVHAGGGDQDVFVGEHGPIEVRAGITAHVADVVLRRRGKTDPPVLSALLDAPAPAAASQAS